MRLFEEKELISYVQGRASEDEMTAIEIAMIEDPRIAEEVEAMALLDQQLARNPGELGSPLSKPRTAELPLSAWLAEHFPWLANPMTGLVSLATTAALAIVILVALPEQPQTFAVTEKIVTEISLLRTRGPSEAMRLSAPTSGAVLLTFDAAGLNSPVDITIEGPTQPIVIRDTAITDELALAVVSAELLQAATLSARLTDSAGQSVDYHFTLEAQTPR